jgi:hypothetical protein
MVAVIIYDSPATMGVRGEIPCIFLGRDAELAGLVAEVGNPPLPYDEIYLSREL